MDEDLEALGDKVHHALRAWRAPHGADSPLRDLQLVRQRVRNGESESQAAEYIVGAALQELEARAPDLARLLRDRFESGRPMATLASRYAWSTATLYKKQRRAILEVARILTRQEVQFQTHRQTVLQRDLTRLSTAPLIGLNPKLATLQPLFTEAAAPWIIALIGMGGIGKTSLADALVRHLVGDGFFERVLWISAQRETLSLGGQVLRVAPDPVLSLERLLEFLTERLFDRTRATWPIPTYDLIDLLQAELKAKPYLLVLDNLETAPNIAELLPFVRNLTAPGKIVVTSRIHLPQEGDIFHYMVPALSFTETHALLQQEARIRSIPALHNCDRATAERIYERVGGNPLAVRLVAGQVQLFGLGQVLEDVRHAVGAGEALYDFLYEAAWRHLPEPSRRLLLAMVLVPQEGEPLDHLTRLVDMSAETLRAALAPLVTQNLVDVLPDLSTPRYTIHNLTRTFLQEAIL